ncbi:hypothetical protein [Halorubrum californiense]|uniref:hypothetical protein n=1 Tax=Halorubrum californiense TaxID=416585 RepID=UPI001267F543|nr:hypothetical protein [Halorubrum californiense]
MADAGYHYDVAADFQRHRDDLRLLNGRLRPVLIGERVRVATRDIPLIGLVDDPMGREPTALEFLGLERHDVALADIAGDRRRNRDEAVAGCHVRWLGVHAPGQYESEDDRLAELLADKHGHNEKDQNRSDTGAGQ